MLYVNIIRLQRYNKYRIYGFGAKTQILCVFTESIQIHFCDPKQKE